MLSKNDEGVSLRLMPLLGIITVVAIICFAGIYALKTSNEYNMTMKDITSEENTDEENKSTIGEVPATAVAEATETEAEVVEEETTLAETATEKEEKTTEEITLNTTSAEDITSRSKIEGVDVNNENSDTTEQKTYISIEEVKISKDMDLTKLTGLSKEDFVQLMADCKYDTTGWFETNAAYIYDLCQEYQLNEIFFCGLISAESGWSIASAHRNAHNYISLMSNGHLIKYSSLEEGLRVAAQKLHNNYLSEGGCFYYGKTLSAVNTKFCGSSTWVNLVYGRMQQIL